MDRTLSMLPNPKAWSVAMRLCGQWRMTVGQRPCISDEVGNTYS